MKEKTLSEKKGYVDSWEIRDAKDVHPSHITAVYEEEDVKQFIKEILDEIMLIKNKDGYYVFDENAEWLYKKIREIIKQKSGFKELK